MTASLAVPVMTADNLSVSSAEVGPEKADQNEEASFEVMWEVAAVASWVAKLTSSDTAGFDADADADADADSTRNFGRSSIGTLSFSA
jgi:hypothetical protein